MKRKPLRFEEQRHQVRFHTHQVQYQNYISGPHTVKLPSKEVVTDPQESTPPPDPLDKHPQLPDPAQTSGPNPTGAATVPGVTPGESGSAGVSSEQMPNPSFQRPGRGNMINPNARHPVPHVGGPMGQVRVQVPSQQQRMQQQQQQYYNYGGGRSLTQEQIRQQMAMKMRLNEIRKNNEIIQNTQHQMMPPMYSGTPGMSINYAGQAQMRRQQLQVCTCIKPPNNGQPPSLCRTLHRLEYKDCSVRSTLALKRLLSSVRSTLELCYQRLLS